MIDSRGSQSLISFTHRFGSSTFVGRHPLSSSSTSSCLSPPPLSLSHSHTLSMNTNAVSGPTSHPPIFFAGMGGRGETEQFQLSILPHEVGSAWLAATPMPFFSSRWAILVILCVATATMSNLCEWRVISDQSWEKEGRLCLLLFFFFYYPLLFFCHLDGKSFLGGEKEESRRQPGKGNNWQQPIPPSTHRLETTEATGVFAFIFRFLFFFFLIALLGGALPFHLLALSVLCLLIYFAIYLVNNFFCLWARQGGRERQRDREKEDGDFFFLAPFILFFSPLLPFIHSFLLSSPFVSLPAFLSLCSPCSLLPPPPPFFLLPRTPPLQSLSTRNFGYFLTPPVLF